MVVIGQLNLTPVFSALGHSSGDTNPMELDIVKQAVIDAETELADKGRVLLRKSGTEPLIRVMVEGEDGELVLALANRIADVVKENC